MSLLGRQLLREIHSVLMEIQVVLRRPICISRLGKRRIGLTSRRATPLIHLVGGGVTLIQLKAYEEIEVNGSGNLRGWWMIMTMVFSVTMVLSGIEWRLAMRAIVGSRHLQQTIAQAGTMRYGFQSLNRVESMISAYTYLAV